MFPLTLAITAIFLPEVSQSEYEIELTQQDLKDKDPFHTIKNIEEDTPSDNEQAKLINRNSNSNPKFLDNLDNSFLKQNLGALEHNSKHRKINSDAINNV